MIAVSRPRVIFKEIDGVKCEPYELLTVDVEDANQGGVMEELGRRRGELQKRIGDPGVRAERARGIGAEAEERAVAERDDAGVAEDQVERQREQDEDQHARAEREIARHEEKERDRQDPRQPLGPADARIGAVAGKLSAHGFAPLLRGGSELLAFTGGKVMRGLRTNPAAAREESR